MFEMSLEFSHGIENFSSMRGNIYNVGLSDANLSKRELCEEIRLQIKKFVFIDENFGKDPDQRNYIVSNEKIERTGYKPEVTLQDGIGELIKGYAMIRKRGHSNI